MLGIDKCCDATSALHIGNRVERNCCLTARLWTINFYDATTRQSTDTKREIEGNRSGWNYFSDLRATLSHSHYGAFAILALNLG